MKVLITVLGIAGIGWPAIAPLVHQGKGEVPVIPTGALQSERRQPLFPKLFPKPTGQNGMEDYVIAADRAAVSLYGQWSNWEANRLQIRRGFDVGPETRAEMLKSRFGDPAKADPIAARRMVLDGFGDIRDRVRQGNLKPVLSLRSQVDDIALFPVLAQFKNLTRFLTLEAYVAFADGNSASGTDALIEALRMANRLPQDDNISRLVTIAMTAIVNAEFERHLDQLSAKDIGRVQATLQSIPDWEAGLLNAQVGQLDKYHALIQKAHEYPKDRGELASSLGLDEKADKLFANLNPAGWAAFVATVQELFTMRMQEGKAILQGPESKWFAEFKAQGWGKMEGEFQAPKDLSEAAEQFVDILVNLTPLWAQSEARYRTQLRLLRLHMRVLAYKWAEMRLPDRLGQAAPAKETEDTFAGGEFQYFPDPYGHYQLFSKGFHGTGRIDLKWRRDPNAPTTDPGDIPPR